MRTETFTIKPLVPEMPMWDVKTLSNEASLTSEDDMQRSVLRADKSGRGADENDVAGGSDTEDTPHGREETKNDKS